MDVKSDDIDRAAGGITFGETEALFAYVVAAYGAVILGENCWRLPKILRSLGAYHEFVAELHGLAGLNIHQLITAFSDDRSRLHALFASVAQAYEGLDRAARKHTHQPLDLMAIFPAEGSELQANAIEERTEWFRQEQERRRPLIDPTVRQLMVQLNTARETLEQGHSVPPEDLRRLCNDIDASDDRFLAKAWLELQRLADWQAVARLQRPEEIAGEIADFDRHTALEGRDNDRDQLRDSMQRLHDAVEAGVANNVLTFARELGAIVLPPLPPINVMLFDDLDDRKKIADKIAAHYRQSPVYFEAHEIAGLAAECKRNSFASTRFTRILERVFDEEAVLTILSDLAREEAQR